MPPTSFSSDSAELEAARAALVDTMRTLASDGLNRGAAGNASVRTGSGFLITPTGMLPADLSPLSMVAMTLDGRVIESNWRPSSEWQFHRDIYRARADAGAVVHVHSPYATAIACMRREIPPFHYMIAVAGGSTIRCAPYATFGTTELSAHVVTALQDRQACLLANHGLVTIGIDLPRARRRAVEVEELARQYLLSLGGGGPVLLTENEINSAIEKFAGYGQQTD